MAKRLNQWGGGMPKKNRFSTLGLVALIAFASCEVKGQEQAIERIFETRASVSFSKKIYNGLKINFTPSFRWIDGEGMNQFNLNAGLSYKPFDFMKLEGGYRLIGEMNQEDTIHYLSRYQFSTLFFTRLGRMEPSLRLSYTNYSDEDEKGDFLRLKFAFGYDIPNCKLTPKVGFELYQSLGLKALYKYRTEFEIGYKISKGVSLQAGYSYDFYKTKYRNRDIFDLGMKFEF